MPQCYRNAVLASALALALAVPVLGAGAAPPRCPPQAETLIAAGWRAYRADSALEALERFDRADRLCPIDLDATVGLGFACLRLGYVVRAESLFARVTLSDPHNSDGWDGLMSAAWRLGDNIEALRAARRSWQIHPGNPEAKLILDRIYPGWDRPEPRLYKRPDSLVVPARASNQRFEVPGPGGWSPFYVKGVHLGVVLPGGAAGDFPPDSARYAGWLAGIAGLNANTVRLATLLPPAFYRALAGWNGAHPQQALWLIQGVAPVLPPGSDFDSPRGLATLRDEFRSVVDAVHGRAGFLARPGHAGGRYDADVSRWTLAWLLDREQDSAAIRAHARAHPGRHMTGGRFLALADGSAMDGWLAARCDELLGYEADRYNTLHPVAYANPLGPEPTARPAGSGDDSVSVDPRLVRATDANPAGWFASYESSPHRSDFPGMNPGDLRDLTRRHAGMPVLIAGYGVPSSRGGHDETTQARIDARLTREIRASGCAGGVVFEWMDEWFRRDPSASDLEWPARRSRFWHDVTNAAQGFGLLAMDAGADGASPELGGDSTRWRALPVLERASGASVRGAPRALQVGFDASYVYLAVSLGRPGQAFGWDSLGISVALDTFRPDRGQRELPNGLASGDLGFEFVADFAGPASAVLRVLADEPHASPRETGRDDHMPLRCGTLAQSTLSDWTYDRASGLLEIRLPWALLEVADPSSGSVLYRDGEKGEPAVAASDGFRIGVVTWRKGGTPRPLAALPALHSGRRWSAADFATWTWTPWEEPEFHARLKPACQALRAVWGGMPDELSSAHPER